MADIDFKNGVNVDSAYMDGHKVRLIAIPDGSLELPISATSDSGYVVDANGKKHRVLLATFLNGTPDYKLSPTADSAYMTVDGQKVKVRLVAKLTNSLELPSSANADQGYALGDDSKKHRVTLVATPTGTLELPNSETDDSAYVVDGNGKKYKVRLFFLAYGGAKEVIIKGVAPLALPDAIADSLSYVKAFGGTEQRNLPAEYTQLEYLGSDSQAYIDTGIASGKDTLTIECKFMYDTFVAYGCVYGNYVSDSHNGIRCILANSGNKIITNNNTICTTTGNTELNCAISQIHTLISKHDTVILDGVATSIQNTATGTENANNIALFNRSITNPNTSRDIGLRVYGFKIYDADVLVSNLIPCRRKSDSVLGMYDTVSGTFFTNAGTGDFTAGPEVVPTPDAPMDIVSNNGVLKINNLFDINSVDNGHYWAADGTYSEASAARLSNSVPVKQGDVIAVTTKVSGSILNLRYNFFDTQMNWLSQTVYSQSAGNTHTEYVTAQQDGYFNFSGNYTGQGSIVLWDEVVIINQSKPIYTDGTVETINAHSTNLLDLANCVDGYYYSGTGEYLPAAAARLSNFIPVKSGVAYTVFAYGLVGSVNVRVNLFGAQKNWLSQTALASRAGEYIAISVTPTQDGYLAFSANFVTSGSCIDWSLSQVVRGAHTVATMPEYAPYYDGGTATAELLLKVGDYQDEQEILSGAVTRKVGVKVFDGMERFTVSSTGAMITQIPDVAVGATNNPINTHFALETSPTSLNVGKQRFGASGTQIYSANYYMKPLTSTTVSNFKQWLADQYAAGTPVTIVYPLATETTESVAGQPLQVQGGDNTLEITQASLTGLELEAQYQAAVSLTIQEVQDANLDNNVQVTIQ